MDKPTSNTASIEPQNPGQSPAKGAWVTPVVREYDPADVTKAFITPGALDAAIYS